MTNRRGALRIALMLAAVAGGWQLWLNRPRDFAFAPIPGAPGWSMARTNGLTSPNANSFATLGRDRGGVEPLPHERLVGVVYRGATEPRIALFSDFFCPFCRALTERLSERPELPIVWHELPLLGRHSELAARAATAADLQDGYAEFVAALSRTGFRPSTQHMSRVAQGIGLDGARLVRDMEGGEVARRLSETRRAAETLGIVGTPATTFGKRVVLGEISLAEFDDLVATETG